jgi:hypothetical protein
MTGRRDEVEHGMDSVVSEPGVSLDTRFLGQDIIVLSLEVAYNLGEAGRVLARFMLVRTNRHQRYLPCFIVDLVAKAGRIDDSQRDAGALLIKFQL